MIYGPDWSWSGQVPVFFRSYGPDLQTLVVSSLIKFQYHSQQYSTLSQIAHDYLAIQGSSVASEQAFSSAGMTDDLRRNRLEAEAFGKLQIFEYAYCTNFLNGSEEAALHEPFHEIEIE
jgi:hypothetical protein